MKPSRLTLFFSGLCMGAADVVPGVSGGTMAWILGIYEQLIGSIGRFDRKSLRFLFFLGCGVATSLVVLSHFLKGLLHDPLSRTYLYSLFFGLILASIFFCLKQVRGWSIGVALSLVAGCAVALGVTQIDLPEAHVTVTLESGLVAEVSESDLGAMIRKRVIQADTLVLADGDMRPAQEVAVIRNGLDPWALFSGALASSAMLLPGISGAYILQILGMYGDAVGAVADFTGGLRTGTIDLDALLLLGSLLIGILGGLLLFSQVILWTLSKHHCLAVAAICGFMIGALRAVWPFWSFQSIVNPLRMEMGPILRPLDPLMPSMADPTTWVALGLVMVGFLLVGGAEAVAQRLRQTGSN